MIFSDIADINPRVKLSRTEEYPFVEMGDITSGKRYVKSVKDKVYKGGGSRFKADDILFARITPCLENGKIAQFKAGSGAVGFGSTEFFVFRAKEGVSDKGFLFYLASSDILRKPAEGSMFGASGRQRAVLDVVKAVVVPDISFVNQKKISVVLSAYDDLIENNTRRIQILEEMCQRIYREWFVDFRFPGHKEVDLIDSEMGKIPEGWDVKPLGEEISIVRGKNLTKQKMEDGLIPVISAGISPSGFHSVSNVKAPAVTISASGANAGYIGFHMNDIWASDCSFFNSDSTEFIFFYYLSLLDRQVEVTNMQRGAAQPHVYPKDLMELKIIVPSENLIKSFDEIAGSFFKLIGNLKSKNEKLKKSRDLLLSKLISGEVDVSELDIELKEEANVA